MVYGILWGRCLEEEVSVVSSNDAVCQPAEGSYKDEATAVVRRAAGVKVVSGTVEEVSMNRGATSTDSNADFLRMLG